VTATRAHLEAVAAAVRQQDEAVLRHLVTRAGVPWTAVALVMDRLGRDEDDGGEPSPADRSAGERFTCPRCGRASSHPRDKAEGYCGARHDWTAPRVP
jgi:hypothetical protein